MACQGWIKGNGSMPQSRADAKELCESLRESTIAVWSGFFKVVFDFSRKLSMEAPDA
jgi:hypothetical protein